MYIYHTGIMALKILKEDDKRYYFICICDCGNEISVRKDHINKSVNSCGCLRNKVPELIGNEYGKLVILKFDGYVYHGIKGRKYKRRKWLCSCGCGNELSVIEQSLLSGNTQSCGCIASESAIAAKFNDLTGRTFDRLFVVKMARRIPNNILWECKCDCGNITEVRGSNLLGDITHSCGCYFKDKVTKHGMCKLGAAAYAAFRRKDPIVRLRHQISNYVRKGLRKKGQNKAGKIFDYLPYTLIELKQHLEKQFEPWMNWENYGGYNNDPKKTWQVDHIKPQSSFNFTSMKDIKFQECWALSNLRPLEKKANMSKGNRMIKPI